MQIIPIQAVASQNFSITLNGQDCDIAIYQKSTGLFYDLILNNELIVSTFLCNDRTYLVRYSYLEFVGNLAFIDTQGTSNPEYTGLGSRYLFVYFFPEDIT